MVARIQTVAFQGIDVLPVDVQVQVSAGLPAFTVVGLADKAVAESRERVRSALGAIGLGLPPKRITVNLAPADLPKEGSHFDLPIALALLAAMGVLPVDLLDEHVALGELALDGAIGAVAGVLPAAIAANALGKSLICPDRKQEGEGKRVVILNNNYLNPLKTAYCQGNLSAAPLLQVDGTAPHILDFMGLPNDTEGRKHSACGR